MPKDFREHHLLQLLDEYSRSHLPLDLAINRYFRSHTALGSKDRGFIAETTYRIIRWMGLLDHLSGNSSWEQRLETFKKIDTSVYQNDPAIPQHIRLSFPKILYDRIVASHGSDQAAEICLTSNGPAPTTVRINSLLCSRETQLQKWSQEGYAVSPTLHAPHGIIFHKRLNFFDLPEFKQGFFEVQDEGSQLISEMVDIHPGEWVLDFCSGSGGKALAFAPKMQGKGQIFLHDIRKSALLEARKRFKRAHIQNYQLLDAGDPKLKKLKKKMHWIIVDVPCTGTGTLRRNPDMKWNFTLEMLERLQGEQRKIFEQALSFLRPDGHIVYSTCSILKEENHSQIDHFLKTYELEMIGHPFESLPTKNGMDGFFAVVLRRSITHHRATEITEH